jgi:hypothetical protein
MLALFEKYRSQIREEENRNSFFDAEQGVYDIAVEYEHEKHNDVAALNHAEAAHGRSLLDAVKFGARIEQTWLRSARPRGRRFRWQSFTIVPAPCWDLEPLRSTLSAE